jgi:hypothetical protein
MDAVIVRLVDPYREPVMRSIVPPCGLKNVLPWGLVLACAGLAGCGGLPKFTLPGLGSPRDAATEQALSEYRYQFQVDRSPEAFNWLLTHCIENGQSVAEVGQVLGETGEREFSDRAMKSHSGHYLETDTGYRWGPDANGRSVVLFFRDGKLVHFDPDELRR